MAPSSSSSPSVLGEKLYQYMELKPFEFRLVRIFPAKMFAIKCEILHESLTHPPPYTALSYAWGDVDDKRTIQLGNIEISVGMGLYGGLEAIRQKGEDVLVWADALCIDQQNRDERSSQVQMMTEIYAKATSVAIWLGPAENKSHLAAEFLKEIAVRARDPEQIQAMISQDRYIEQIEAVACLFQRDYWSRLWVVQEVFNARSISVYCGLTKLPWSLYKTAAQVFQRHKKDLDLYFSGTASDSRNRRRFSTLTSSLSYAQVLVYDGPGSLLDFGSLDGVGDEALLDVMRTSRRKLTSEPRDKIFGVLGVLPEDIRREFPVDYSLSVKDVYTDIVDFLIYTTERLDVICESIHFPAQTHTARLPSWVPDWSQHSETSALGHLYNFSAARDTNARYQFLDKRRNELKISAIYIDTIRCHGIAVGTLCTLADYLMAFLHWRALLLDYVSSEPADYQMEIQEAFCRTLSLGQVPSEWRGRSQDWMRRCYEVFATHIRKRLPQLPLDDQLHAHLLADGAAKQDIRQFLQRNFGAHMMGRSFFISRRSRVGMGSGFMLPDDIIVVPLGCRTPIILREEGGKEGRYRYVGDVYVDGYMDGKAIDLLNSGEKQLKEYVLV
ncbi:heterokaryon incompatibility protein-domain-containing protein [Xylariales sp. PMI_506]|nr:heterokaryon incompatibility protein-domain-containing protein [Xylariales sp. PMI_506]